MLLALAIATGMGAGVLFGLGLASLVSLNAGCVLPVEATVDPFVGLALGGWYGVVTLERLAVAAGRGRHFLSPTLHTIFDTSLGVWLGYHLGTGLYVGAARLLDIRFEPFLPIFCILVVPILVGVLFNRSTTRWIHRTHQHRSQL